MTRPRPSSSAWGASMNGRKSSPICMRANDFVILGDVIDGQYQGPAFLKGKEVFGEAGNDTMIGLGASDKIYGGKGSDLIWGGAGDDTIVGGAAGDGDKAATRSTAAHGNDTITFVNGGQIAGGSGNDTIDGPRSDLERSCHWRCRRGCHHHPEGWYRRFDRRRQRRRHNYRLWRFRIRRDRRRYRRRR